MSRQREKSDTTYANGTKDGQPSVGAPKGATGNSCSEDKGIAPIPPDGGWGWVVTFSSFMIGVIVDGICFTFGFFFIEFQTYFGSNKSVTSLINSVLNGTYLTIGKCLFDILT